MPLRAPPRPQHAWLRPCPPPRQTSDGEATIDWVYTGGDEAEITAVVKPMLESPFYIDGSYTQAVHATLADYSINAYNTAGLWMRRFVINSLVLPDQVPAGGWRLVAAA